MGQFAGPREEDDDDNDDDDDIEKEESEDALTSGRSRAGVGARPEGAARRRPFRPQTMTAAGAEPRTTTTTATTKTERSAEAERTIFNRTQEEKEKEAEIIGQYFFSTPAPLPSSTPTDLKLDKHTTCM